MTTKNAVVFYDGLCHLCSREIDLLRRLDSANRLTFVDIMAPDFEPTTYQLDPKRIHAEMHVEVDGTMRVGLDALIGMWECVPLFRWLAALVSLPVIYTLATFGYHFFAWIRPKLPRRRSACANGACAV